jgi:hypothetical protein
MRTAFGACRSISEITGMEGDTPQMQDIFLFRSKRAARQAPGRRFRRHGHRAPRCRADACREFRFPMHLFQPVT